MIAPIQALLYLYRCLAFLLCSLYVHTPLDWTLLYVLQYCMRVVKHTSIGIKLHETFKSLFGLGRRAPKSVAQGIAIMVVCERFMNSEVRR